VYVTNVVTLKGFYMTTLTTKDTQYRKEIVKMARQAGFIIDDDNPVTFSLEAFAKLVADKAAEREREACAIACETDGRDLAGLYYAGVIRARGTNE
jgi:hypothetical protein